MINVFGANVGQEELEEVHTSLTNSWMGMGQKVKQFEQELSQRLNLPIVMLDNASNALYLAVYLLDLPKGSKIILPTFTWLACANAIILAGHIPVFADVDIATQNITPQTIEPLLDKNVKAIMVVHYAGLPVDVPAIKSFGLPIIEDAAHAIDSKLYGIPCGGLGDIGVFSFDAVKNLASPEAGAITWEIAREYRYCGLDKTWKDRWWEDDIKHIWHKNMPNDIAAGIALAQLRKLDDHQKRRKEIWNRYRELPVIHPVSTEDYQQHSYFTYFVRVKRRDALARYLLDNGVYTTLRYRPLHMSPIYGSTSKLPVSELLAEEGLNLPLHPALTDDDVDKVISLVKKF